MSLGIQSFRQALEHYPIFSLTDIKKKFPGFDRKRLIEWQAKGYLAPVARGFYAWPGRLNHVADKWALACKVYAPAYISLEAALSFYGFIPEGVFSVTAITTHKTRRFFSGNTGYIFRNLKPSLFFGYFIEKAPNSLPYCLASPEKGLLDVFYLTPHVKGPDDFEAMRFNKWQIRGEIDQGKLAAYGKAMGGKSFAGRVAAFISWVND